MSLLAKLSIWLSLSLALWAILFIVAEIILLHFAPI